MNVKSLLRVVKEEVGPLELRNVPTFFLLSVLVPLLPAGRFGRVRAALYRAAGVTVGRGVILAGRLSLGTGTNPSRITVGDRCYLNQQVFIDAGGAPVRIGDGASVGHHVVIITTDHAVGAPGFRAGWRAFRPVTIDAGAWIAARVTILPGVTVGAGAIVGAGAVVTRDVPPHAVVAGVPARVIRYLDEQ